MIEINYINLKEQVSKHKIKVYERIYVGRKPFAKILCLFKLVQCLYLANCIHETILKEKEQLSIKEKVGRIFKRTTLTQTTIDQYFCQQRYCFKQGRTLLSSAAARYQQRFRQDKHR